MATAIEYIGQSSFGDHLYLASGHGCWRDNSEPVVSVGMRVSSAGNIWRVLAIASATEYVTVAREPDLNDTYRWHVSSLLQGYPVTHTRFLKRQS